MAASDLSYSRPLRAIGQALEVLRIDAFDLRTEGDDYVVHSKSKRPSRGNSSRNFLQNLVEKVWGPAEDELKSAGSPPEVETLRYTPSDIAWLEREGQLRRGEPNAMPDTQRTSQVLRVIGDYLDHKHARGFRISWSVPSVAISYQTRDGNRQRDNIQLDTLYDLGVRMYLRRSSRRES